MLLQGVRIEPVRLELARPLKTARATYTVREGFRLWVGDEEGRVGQGEAMLRRTVLTGCKGSRQADLSARGN